jgi:hypothetical protein
VTGTLGIEPVSRNHHTREKLNASWKSWAVVIPVEAW